MSLLVVVVVKVHILCYMSKKTSENTLLIGANGLIFINAITFAMYVIANTLIGMLNKLKNKLRTITTYRLYNCKR